jgi:hypothetical protein
MSLEVPRCEGVDRWKCMGCVGPSYGGVAAEDQGNPVEERRVWRSVTIVSKTRSGRSGCRRLGERQLTIIADALREGRHAAAATP